MKSALPVLFILFFALTSCDRKTAEETSSLSFRMPEEGENVDRGDEVKMSLNLKKGQLVDSIVYLVDSVRITAAKDSSPVSFKTDSLNMGSRLITARVYSKGDMQEASTNIIVFAAKQPEILDYKVLKTFPHDTSAYTQGLEYHDGVFYESAGGMLSDGIGISSLRKVQPETGKVLQKISLDPTVFAEGLSVVGDKILQLTWQNKEGYVYDKNTFKKTGNFPYQNSLEGWGLCFDGKHFLKSDGTNRIWFLNKDDYHEEGSIEVYDFQYPVDQLNELEYINGKIYANIYMKDTIVVINPKNGEVEEKIDCKGLLPQSDRSKLKSDEVLNGIAYDAKNSRLFLTGKKWPKLYQVELLKKPPVLAKK